MDSDDSSEQPDPDSLAGRIAQLEHQLFTHRLTLQQHDNQLRSPADQLTVMVVQMIFGVFGGIICLAVAAVALGFTPISTAVSYLKSTFFIMGGLASVLIFMILVLTFSMTSVAELRSGLTPPPDPRDTASITDAEADVSHSESASDTDADDR